MTLKVKINNPIVNANREYPRMHVWCKFPAQIYNELSRGQAKFPIIMSQNGQDYLKGQSQRPPFTSRMYPVMQFWS